jgi:hypothetical protein
LRRHLGRRRSAIGEGNRQAVDLIARQSGIVERALKGGCEERFLGGRFIVRRLAPRRAIVERIIGLAEPDDRGLAAERALRRRPWQAGDSPDDRPL